MKKKILNYKVIKRYWKIKVYQMNQLASEQDYPLGTDRHLDNGGNPGNHSTPTLCANHMVSLETMPMRCSNQTRMPGRELQEMK